MSKRRICVFNEELQKEFKCMKLDTKFSDGTRVICSQCGGSFSVAHGGKSDICQHLRSQKHKDAEKVVASARPISSFMVKHEDAAFFKVAASEAVFAYHCVRHAQSFRSNDCLSKLINKLYDPEFSSARTKSEAIVTNVLSPFALQEVVDDLRKVKSVTISVDASNKKDVKLFPVMVRYFLPDRGVQDKILDFVSLPGEASDLQCAMLTDVCDRYDLRNKIVALCADNTNTNFGGCKRQGKNNVWQKLENVLQREIMGIGCGAHILHNCLQTAVDCLPIDVESFAVKVYKYFYIYTVRVEQLKGFCEFVGDHYAKLLEHGNTRFLSLGPSIERILSMFDGLRSYFLSQDKCPVMLRDLFENPCLKLWLLFIRDQLVTFQTYISFVERDNASATEVAAHFDDFVKILEHKRDETFLTSEVQSLLNVLIDSGEIQKSKFLGIVRVFYDTALGYVDKWKSNLGETQMFRWILLKVVPEWSEIQNSVCQKLPVGVKIEEIALFDQWTMMKEIVIRDIKTWNRESVPVADRWMRIFLELESKSLACPDFEDLVGYVLCLPGSSAPVERIFSIMNSMWTKEKSRLNVDTMKAMIVVKQNFESECNEFYDKISKNFPLLRKVSSSAKYSWSVGSNPSTSK